MEYAKCTVIIFTDTFLTLLSPFKTECFLCADLVQNALQVDALWPLDGQAQCPIPNELCEGPEATADTEGCCVIERLFEAIMVEEDARGRVDVGVRVFSLQREISKDIVQQ